MTKTDCIFCQIVSGELPSYKVYEDENFLAFLDIFPSHYGQTLVIPKQHLDSNFSHTNTDTLKGLVSAGQKIAKTIEDKLNAERCIVVIEGLELDHLHLKLYPALSPEPAKYAVSKSGGRATEKELQQVLKRVVG